MALLARAAGLLAGYAADLALGDPRRGHPVAVFGRSARALESRVYADDLARGTGFTAALVGGTTALGWAAHWSGRRSPVVEAAVVAAATWMVLGGRSLGREGDAMTALLASDDLSGARARLSHLCSRDATHLQAPDLARATVESLAENTSDAVVAPLFWGAVAGPAGLVGYRAANTLDAMVGYRNERYSRFGWASARLDDAANLVPSRLSALLAVGLAPRVGGNVGRAWSVWQRDASIHPSPNAGQVEAAFAGALGVKLGGVNTYGGASEQRGVMDGGREVDVHDVARTARLSRLVGGAAAVSLAGALVAVAARRRVAGRRHG